MIVVCLLVEESGFLLCLAPYLHKCLCAYIYSLGSSFLTSCRTLSPRQKEGALRRAAIKQVAAYERSREEKLNRGGYFLPFLWIRSSKASLCYYKSMNR